MYAANITGDIDQMLRRHDHVLATGGTCIMVSMNSIGLPAMKVLRAHSQLCIHGHRNGWGMLGRSPAIGMSFVAFQKFWRLAGIDHTHVNGLQQQILRSGRKRDRLGARVSYADVSPAARGLRDHARLLLRAIGAPGCRIPIRRSGSTDLIFAAGGGIMGHPAGPAAGVRSLQQAWEAAIEGIPVTEFAATIRSCAQHWKHSPADTV